MINATGRGVIRTWVLSPAVGLANHSAMATPKRPHCHLHTLQRTCTSPRKCPFQRASGPPSETRFTGPTQVWIANGISISPAASARDQHACQQCDSNLHPFQLSHQITQINSFIGCGGNTCRIHTVATKYKIDKKKHVLKADSTPGMSSTQAQTIATYMDN